MDDLRVGDVIEVAPLDQPAVLQQPLGLFGAVLGQDHALLLLVELIVGRDERLHQLVDRNVEIGLVVGRAGNDQRRPGFVDQDRIHLVDDPEIERPLDHLRPGIFHVVAQVIEAELVIGRVGDVASIGLPPLLVGKVGDDHADGHAEEAVDLPHPVRVAAGEIVVDGDDVDAAALERIQIDGERRDQGLALAGLHFGDLAPVEGDAADQLDVVVALAERPDRGLAHRREGFGKEVVELFAAGEPRAEQLGPAAQLVIRQGLDRRLQSIDRVDIFAKAADIAVVGRSEDVFCHCGEHEIPLKSARSRKSEIARRRSENLRRAM